ncbi:restriction endonuclease subunit S [Morganella morganii]|uniref:restriction endonuclease subunit S n=1 Tax=Morganella morganii TaxID=582 RepID=UPI001891BEAF|nr:restriction endonuclease subunit S [Morganella morganii]
MLPEGWSVLKLDDVVTKTQLGTTERGTEDKSSSNSIPLIKMGNLGWGSINFKKVEMIDKSYFDESLLLERGDFLFNTRNTPDLVGKSAVWLEDYPATFDNNINRISFKPVINSYYISYYLNNGKGKSLIQALPAGSTSVAAIYWKDLKNIKLVLPPLPEQKKIAQILSTWDNAISATKRLLENSQQRKKALMQQLLTGKKRLPGFEGEWRKLKLKDCATCHDNKRKPLNSEERSQMKGTIPYWGANGIVDYVSEYIFDGEFVLLAEDGGNFSEYQTRPIANILRGKAWVNNHAHILSGKKDCTNAWLYYSLVHKNILGFVNGGTRAKLNKSDMLLIPINLPSIKEQQAIAKVLITADQEIDALQKRLEHLKLEKKALMQQLLTGKRRVVADVDAA